MKCFITGICGFIGSNLAERLLAEDNEVKGIDNLSTGKIKNIEDLYKNKNFSFINADIISNHNTLIDALKGSDIVFHLAANADVRYGLSHPLKDLTQNVIGTSAVLEAMRVANVKKIMFSSTGSVYGNTNIFPTPEDISLPPQTSLYSASKLSAESFINAYCYGYGMQSYIFRFVSVMGKRYSHGHLFDFYKSLKANPLKLNVLGNGKQTKSYMNVADCISGILVGINSSKDNINVFNLGLDETITVKNSIKIISKYMNLTPEIKYEKKDQGWIGDNKLIQLDCSKIKNLGWNPVHTIKDSIIETLEYFDDNPWMF